ncbi:threonine synthase [Catalinimonas alkaloidigena]|uniref:Threonine synthase n=1 Tax=Catalinimonas alkaloidigena TaxID=1075417 RepID=A0A1G9T2D3_9BACT|nr:threonine synthase [Catalinimonas alkaloidigena]SDM41245.1 threonine synthase [Catalinimonas alkaloidigena]
MPINYHSTNRHLPSGTSERFRFAEALARGQAPDGGLLMPDQIPTLSPETLERLRGKPYAEVAFAVLYPFVEGEIEAERLRALLYDAYTFDIPVEPLGDQVLLARLDQGPTASFKDFAARAMARLMNEFRPPEQQVTVLVATSGDTGSAVGEAFKGLDGFRVVILFPEQEVSAVQKHQLESIGGNVVAVSIDGKFDDCQRYVKAAFTDPDLKALGLTSANSINVGRVLPQVVYYVYLYLKVAAPGETLNFCIPSGNLGNSLGGEIARRMGLPIGTILIATNRNDALPSFLQSGAYAKIDPSRACLSNAMNVGNPSNLARYFDLYGGTVDKDGVVHRQPDLEQMRQNLKGVAVTDEATRARIRTTYDQYGVVVEPHGAVGLEGLAQVPLPGRTICFETAHPAKFPEVVEEVLRLSPAPTPALEAIQHRTGKSVPLPNDYKQLKAFLLAWQAADTTAL